MGIVLSFGRERDTLKNLDVSVVNTSLALLQVVV